MAALNDYSKKQEAEIKGNPLAGLLAFRTMIVGARAVQTDGLPDDLKAAFADCIATLNKASEVFKGWPDKPDDVLNYVRQQIALDPKYMDTFSAKMNAMSKDMDAMSQKMDEMGKKYGFSIVGGPAAPK